VVQAVEGDSIFVIYLLMFRWRKLKCASLFEKINNFSTIWKWAIAKIAKVYSILVLVPSYQENFSTIIHRVVHVNNNS